MVPIEMAVAALGERQSILALDYEMRRVREAQRKKGAEKRYNSIGRLGNFRLLNVTFPHTHGLTNITLTFLCRIIKLTSKRWKIDCSIFLLKFNKNHLIVSRQVSIRVKQSVSNT